MFSGIIETTGKVLDLTKGNQNCCIHFGADVAFCKNLSVGCSVAVSGVCLTVTDLQKDSFTSDISDATMNCTTFQQLSAGDEVNLELSLRLDQGIDGHLVTGHVDGVGTIKVLKDCGESTQLTVEVPANLMMYIAQKGSICIDGVSLTVNTVNAQHFDMNLIPHTFKLTTFKHRKAGDQVNIEVDIIARYVNRQLNQ